MVLLTPAQICMTYPGVNQESLGEINVLTSMEVGLATLSQNPTCTVYNRQPHKEDRDGLGMGFDTITKKRGKKTPVNPLYIDLITAG